MKLTFPPDNPSEAGTWRNSRPYEALPIVLPVLTYLILMWCCVVHYLIFSVRGDDLMQMVEMYDKLGAPTLRNPYDEPLWKFVTSCFVHSQESMMHLIFNMMWLLQLGPLMERGLGLAKTVLFIVAVGFVSSAIATATEGFGIGMSGVVYAMGGFMWTAWPRWTGFLEKFNGNTIKFMLFWQVICLVMTYTNVMNIGNVAHVSGMVYGALIGKWACLGNKYGKPWMAASIGFTLLGVVCAFRPMSAWF